MATGLVGFVCFGAVVANAALSVGDSIGAREVGGSLTRWAGVGVVLMATGALFLGRQGLRLAWNWLRLDADYPVVSLPDRHREPGADQASRNPRSRENPFLAAAPPVPEPQSQPRTPVENR